MSIPISPVAKAMEAKLEAHRKRMWEEFEANISLPSEDKFWTKKWPAMCDKEWDLADALWKQTTKDHEDILRYLRTGKSW